MTFFNHTIKKAVLESPWRYLFILWVGLFLLIDYFANEIHLVGLSLFDYSLTIAIPFITLILLNGLLVGLNINLAIMRFRALRSASSMKAGAGTSILGTTAALFAGACPGCIAGIFPAVMGSFGASSFTLTQLPFYGLEILVLSALLLLFGAYKLSQPLVCKI